MPPRTFLLSSALLLACGLSAAARASQATSAPAGKTLTLQQCPPAVQQTLTRESRDGTILDIEMLETNAGPVYVAGARVGGREYDLQVRGSGLLVMKGLSILDEGQVAAGDLPAPVRATFEREAQGGTIAAPITAHNPQLVAAGQGPNRVFTGAVTIEGCRYQVEVREDGLLLGKELTATPQGPGAKP